MNTTAIPRPTRIASVSNIRQAWQDSKDASGKGRAAGVDRVTAASFRENLSKNIELLRDRLVSGSFHFQRLRPICIQKPNGKVRIICVPTVADRLVQRLIANYLSVNDKLEIGNSVSYGAMRGRGGTRAAIRDARNFRREYPWVFKSDISQFFDQIPRERLKVSLERKLKRSSIVPLLHAAIDCEIDNRGSRNAVDISNAGIREGLGLRQGMPLSPMLSNYVLKKFDQQFGRRRDIRLLRYADDFMILTKTKKDRDELFPEVFASLKQLELEIPDPGPESKTALLDPDETVNFLGMDLSRSANGHGYEIRVPQKAFESIKNQLSGFKDFGTVCREYRNFSQAVAAADWLADGFVNVYRHAKNFEDLRSHAMNCRAEAMKGLLGNIFGIDVLDRIDEPRRNFLEISKALMPSPSEP